MVTCTCRTPSCVAYPCFKRAGSNSTRRKSRLWGEPRQSLAARSLVVFEGLCSRHSHLYVFHGRATFAVGDAQLGVPRKEQPCSTLHAAWVGPTQTERVPRQLLYSVLRKVPVVTEGMGLLLSRPVSAFIAGPGSLVRSKSGCLMKRMGGRHTGRRHSRWRTPRGFGVQHPDPGKYRWSRSANAHLNGKRGAGMQRSSRLRLPMLGSIVSSHSGS